MVRSCYSGSKQIISTNLFISKLPARASFVSRYRQLPGLLLGAGCLVLIALQLHEVGTQPGLADSWLTALPRVSWLHLGVVLLLMPVNWLLEGWKWHLLHRHFSKWPVRRTIRALLVGITLSIVTPNRVGEHGGRMLAGPRGEAPQILCSSLLSSGCQWLAFLLLGWPALIYTAADWWHWPARSSYAVAAAPLFGLILGYRYLSINMFPRWVRYPLVRLKRRLGAVKFWLICAATGIACSRFAVYCLQFYLLLQGLGLPLHPFSGLAGVAAIFTLQAGIPMPPGVGMLTRTEFGMLLWGDSMESTTIVLLASTLLFVINLILPALAGLYFLTLTRIQSS